MTDRFNFVINIMLVYVCIELFEQNTVKPKVSFRQMFRLESAGHSDSGTFDITQNQYRW